MHDLQQDQELDRLELRYLSAFIRYKELDEEYVFFREHAREVYDEDLPFPKLTL